MQTAKLTIEPRLIRFRDAPRYLGMDRNRFNRDVRPYLTVIPIGKQGIAFDRLDLDAWIEQYKHRSGRPATSNLRGELWDASKRQDFSNAGSFGTLKKESADAAFEKALAQVCSKKRNAI